MAKKLKERKVNLKTLKNESESEIRKNLAWKIQVRINFEKSASVGNSEWLLTCGSLAKG